MSNPAPREDVVSILVVDDDEVDARSITRGLRKQGVDNPIEVARNGIEALARLRGDGTHPAMEWPFIVLLDLNMPRMNGLEFLDAIRADPELNRVVVFVLTTSDDDRDKVEAYRRHIAGYLVKRAAGADFVNMITMLESFVLTVRFPAARAAS